MAPDGAGKVYVIGNFRRIVQLGATTLINPNKLWDTSILAALAEPILAATTPGQAGVPLLTLTLNPAHGHATVLRPAALAPGATLSLLDALGRPVGAPTRPPAASTSFLDPTGLAPGFYLVRLRSGNTQLTRRPVVQ